ncbi:RNA polymerase II transcription factor B subunit 4 [Malassezia yamatoensis]|uniref:General transcription and DNA repair factor IIH subunit TFB4 n=1 Tax=Malassezia yamatoensis TaxID=253288 RepID=A0AAJ6CFX5_9BASI|nr:RNA polymerase II transcription factor B subunit 4 [Malassezia yamatoensis]
MASNAVPTGIKKEDALSGLVGGSSDNDTLLLDRAPDFLVVILDLNPEAWQRSHGVSKEYLSADAAFQNLKQTLSTILVFLNAHIAMQHGSGVAVYGAVDGTAELLYTTAPFVQKSKHADDQSTISACLPFKTMDDALFSQARKLIRRACEKLADGSARESNGLVRALSLALCHINRVTIMARTTDTQSDYSLNATNDTKNGHQHTSVGFHHRILIMSVTPDASAQYVPMMNCIFSAQKQGIQIDVCKLLGEDTVFLRQACHLTDGHYYSMPTLDGLLEVLAMVFLPSKSIRPVLMFPAMDDVDFRAACFCHRRNVDIGYVCSVCLSIFCGLRRECLICQSEFPPSTLKRFEDEQAVAEMLRSG